MLCIGYINPYGLHLIENRRDEVNELFVSAEMDWGQAEILILLSNKRFCVAGEQRDMALGQVMGLRPFSLGSIMLGKPPKGS